MLIYNYSRNTFEYVGEPKEARLDPIGNNPLIPAFATTIEPPSTGDNEVAVFNEETNEWSIQDDYRGTVYYDENGFPSNITNIGEDVPDGFTTEQPPEKVKYYNIINGSWTLKPINDIKELKINDVYENVAILMDELLGLYSMGETDTWSKMNDECVQYQADGTIGPLMAAKISVDPEYNTADKLATMTIAEYQQYITRKFNIEAQRSQHKININSITDVNTLLEYDTSVS